MANLKKFIGSLRLVRIKGRKLTVVMLIIAMVLSMSTLAMLHILTAREKKATEELRQKATDLTIENEELQEDIDQAGSIQSIVEIAEKELGLVQPDSVFYIEEEASEASE